MGNEKDTIYEFMQNYENILNSKSEKELKSFYSNIEDSLHYNNLIEEKKGWFKSIQKMRYNQKITNVTIIDNNQYLVKGLRSIYDIRENTEIIFESEWIEWTLVKKNYNWTIFEEKNYNYCVPNKSSIKANLDIAEKKLDVNYSIDIKIKQDFTNSIIFYLHNSAKINKIFVNDSKLKKFIKQDNLLIIPNDFKNKKDDILNLKISYNIAANEYSFRINENNSFSSWLSGWYPTLRGIQSQSTGINEFTVPMDLTVISNGKLIKKSEDIKNNTAKYIFEVKKPSNLAFAFGKYFQKKKTVDGIDYEINLLSDNPIKAEMYLKNSIKVISFLKNNIFKMYPYETYKLVEVDENNPGSCENGMTYVGTRMLSDDDYNLPVLSHEISHLWWGSWIIGKGVLMSEGLAQLGYLLTIEHFWGKEKMYNYIKWGDWGYDQSGIKYIASIAGREEVDLPMITYDKGTHTLSNTKGLYLLIMLRDVIGEKHFYQGLRNALTKYPNSLIDVLVLKKEWENSSRIDLDWYFNQWFYRSEIPELNFEYYTKKMDDGTYEINGSINQKNTVFKLPVELNLIDQENKNSFIKKIMIDKKENNFVITSKFDPKEIILDPFYKILKLDEHLKNFNEFGNAINSMYSYDMPKVIESLNKQIQLEPKLMLPKIYLGILSYLYLRDQKTAKTLFLEIINNVNHNGQLKHYLPMIYNYLGDILLTEKNNEDALKYYKKALSLDDINKNTNLFKKKIKEIESKQ